MPQLSEESGTAAATRPALTKKAEREIGSPSTASLTGSATFLLFNLLILIINLLKSSINKNGSNTNLHTTVKKKATKMIDFKDKNKTVLKYTEQNTPIIKRIVYVQ